MTIHAKKIGFTCAYAPLALIDAAGFTPYRVLPMGELPDQAGHLLHDNLCPHVKRILDRAIEKDLPELDGMIFINSCDAMRRVSDAWQKVRPNDKLIRIDLPTTTDDLSVAYLGKELSKAWEILTTDSRSDRANNALLSGIERYNQVAKGIESLRKKISKGLVKMSASDLQSLYNRASTQSFDETLAELTQLAGHAQTTNSNQDKIPLFLFGNVLPDPEVFALFEACGAKISGDDFCTGSRLFNSIQISSFDDIFLELAQNILTKPPCARTFKPESPLNIATEVLSHAKACGAKGIIAYTMKFCDSYLARLPMIRKSLKQAGFPFLLLEGDCTLRSIGQQQTRIEAFIEMLR